jgi:hypothetical protein
MGTRLRHRKTFLERALPESLFYSTNETTAKMLIHIKETRRKVTAIKRAYFHDMKSSKDKKTLLRGLKEQVTAIEESYTDVVLPQQQILIWIPRHRRRSSRTQILAQKEN